MAEVALAEIPLPPETSASGVHSPPPNCAICLGNCVNKCFSDSCMHQFCFKCLLEWSKVKAVCPLCKQPFTSIIHNVKSNNEYEQHYIGPEQNSIQEDDFDEHFIVRSATERRNSYGYYLPTGPAPSRHFQFRTTLTVDPRGELAIQQLLSSHPLTNSFYEYLSSSPGFNGYHASGRHSGRRRYRDVSSTSYRRHIYNNDLWVHGSADVTGRVREISPQFYRENPAARNRLVPWLNRELNALLLDHTQHVMDLVDLILSHLDRHHIMSRYFKQLLVEHLGNRAEHFIHELFNYMRSPFDMIGYDHNVFYTAGMPPQFSINLTVEDDDSSDSDVAIVPAERTPTTDPVVIELNYSDSSRDSDVIIREPTPPVVVDLVNTDSSDTDVESNNHKPMLPLKIRLKRKQQSKENKLTKKSNYSSISESSDSSDNSSDSYFNKYRSKHKYKKSKYYIIKDAIDSDSDSADNEPILNRLKKEREDRKRKKLKKTDRKKRQKKEEEAVPVLHSPEPMLKQESDSDSYNTPLSTLVMRCTSQMPPLSPNVRNRPLANGNVEPTQEGDEPGTSSNAPVRNGGSNSWYARPMSLSPISSDENSA